METCTHATAGTDPVDEPQGRAAFGGHLAGEQLAADGDIFALDSRWLISTTVSVMVPSPAA